MSTQQPIEAGPFRAAAVDLAGPTQSIQIARTLIDRYAELVRDSNGIGARNVDRIELIIGEASQIYPEIWSKLDTAHAALKKRGIEVPEYVALRGTGSNGAGVLAVDVQNYGRYTEKTASFDAAGNARARQACDALRRAMPAVDWAALDQKDAALMAAAGSLGPSKTAKVIAQIVLVLAFILVAVVFVVFRLGLY
jgi:non-ribosomal peptide synthetase component E (peptide arylation enzyme)